MIVYCKECKNRYTEDCPMWYPNPDLDGDIFYLVDDTIDYGFYH